jgi:hypothetical protein
MKKARRFRRREAYGLLGVTRPSSTAMNDLSYR